MCAFKDSAQKKAYYFNGLRLLLNLKCQSQELIGYFDSNTTNVIVSVTDDATVISDTDFINFLEKVYGSISTFRYYDYINPDQGFHYQYLARKLGDTAHDITSNSQTLSGRLFKDLVTKSQVKVIINTVRLKSKCISLNAFY